MKPKNEKYLHPDNLYPTVERKLFTYIKYEIILGVKGVSGLDPIQVDLMSTSLALFIDSAIDKFLKGQLEHGGDIRDRDLDEEIKNEHIDLFWYNEARKWPTHLTKFNINNTN